MQWHWALYRQSSSWTYRKRGYLLVGVDALTEAVQNVIDGKQTGTVFNDHFSQAKAAADAAVQFISGEDVDAVNMLTTSRLPTQTLRRFWTS